MSAISFVQLDVMLLKPLRICIFVVTKAQFSPQFKILTPYQVASRIVIQILTLVPVLLGRNLQQKLQVLSIRSVMRRGTRVFASRWERQRRGYFYQKHHVYVRPSSSPIRFEFRFIWL